MQNNEITVNAVSAETALESSENESLLSLVDSSQAQNIALIIISTLAVVFVLQWAASFIITLLLGLLLSTILNPLVSRLEKLQYPSHHWFYTGYLRCRGWRYLVSLWLTSSGTIDHFNLARSRY